MLTREYASAFVACLNEERYYDAHEALEELWFPLRTQKTPEILLLKGLINASVSFELHKRGRPHKAPGPWGVYMKYREYLPQIGKQNPLYLELDDAVHAVQRRLSA
ncbi:DUF309 domain-containing protein [Sulfurimonas sp. HSL1-2]|uniref:DUF309 domain-containing protein n=1 Tax=Thiomicrolovo zhangzhouensis TaxID=3131933 RepID=UPI0031F95605